MTEILVLCAYCLVFIISWATFQLQLYYYCKGRNSYEADEHVVKSFSILYDAFVYNNSWGSITLLSTLWNLILFGSACTFLEIIRGKCENSKTECATEKIHPRILSYVRFPCLAMCGTQRFYVEFCCRILVCRSERFLLGGKPLLPCIFFNASIQDFSNSDNCQMYP